MVVRKQNASPIRRNDARMYEYGGSGSALPLAVRLEVREWFLEVFGYNEW